MSMDLPKGAQGPDEAAVPINQSPDNPDQYNRLGQELPSTYMQSLKANLGLTYSELPTNKLANYILDRQLEQQNGAIGLPKLSAGEANAKYPYVDNPFTSSVDPQVAAEIAKRAMDRHELMNTIERGPQGGLAGASRFASGMALGVMDPLSMGAAIVGGNALSLGLKAAEGSSIASRLAFMAAENPSATQAFARNSVHALVGGASMEAANAPLTIHDQQPYSIKDAAANVATFSLGYAGLKGLAGVAGRYTQPYVDQFLGRIPEAKQATVEAAVGQLVTDRTVDVTPVQKAMTAEMEAKGNGAVPLPDHSPIESAADLKGRDLYIPSQRQSVDLKTMDHAPIEGDFGQGVYMTDAPGVANGIAASSFSASDGKILEVKVDGENTKLLNLDKPLPDDVKALAKSFFTELGHDELASKVDDIKGQDLYKEMTQAIQHGELPETALEDFNKKLGEAGFDGIHYEGGNVLGEQNSPHNVVMMFDPEKTGDAGGKVQQSGEFAPDRNLNNGLSYEDITGMKADAMSPEKSASFDPADVQRMQDLKMNPPVEWNIPKLEEYTGKAVENLESLREQGLLDNDAIKELEDLKEQAKRDRDQDIVDKAAMFCMGRD